MVPFFTLIIGAELFVLLLIVGGGTLSVLIALIVRGKANHLGSNPGSVNSGATRQSSTKSRPRVVSGPVSKNGNKYVLAAFVLGRHRRGEMSDADCLTSLKRLMPDAFATGQP